MKTTDPEGLYANEVYDESLRRIEALEERTVPVWGSMSPAQMLAHCAEVQEVQNGSRELVGTPFPLRLMARLVRRAVVSEKPYPRGLRTHPQYLQTDDRDFDVEKRRLLRALEAFREAEHGPPARHPLFGMLNRQERGWSSYKHLDHHLRQFGV
jgi:hypothetical protein